MRSDRSLGPDPAGPHRLWQRMGFQSKRSGICWRVSAVMRIQVIFLAAVMWSGGGFLYTRFAAGKKVSKLLHGPGERSRQFGLGPRQARWKEVDRGSETNGT